MTTPRRRRRPGLERLMKAADELLYAEGIARTGVQRILEEADVARGTLYGNFASKDELVEAYLAQRHEGTLAAIVEQVGDATAPQEVFEAFLAVGERRSSADGFRGCAFSLAVAEIPDEGGVARRWAATHKTTLKRMLVESLGARADADDVAEELMVLYDGALLSAALRPGAGSFAAARRAGRSVLADGGVR
ncbi:TetR/AcrR family transcriptional regulator [Aeromicrobium sp. Leaf291]|uniref:TetR/AcrR family transcriptional regulator n=1 Tax=Aeromicrobium sp. Leaf291 TaxID=1736325 RepID=UPI0012E20EBB|nr:TetR/AcrR family transcriptional regulator [Aeromicrobium sp. Leaf291]